MMRPWMTALVAATSLAAPPAASAPWQATSDGAWAWCCGRTPRPRRPRWPTSLLDDLDAATLIERRPDPADRRARRIVATRRGTELLATLNDRLRAAEAHLLAPLDPETRDTFRAQVRLLATRADALDPVDSP